jgi:chromosome segregation ATPase
MRAKYQEAKKQMDRIKEESSQNKRMLLEMSSVINALKDISIDYDLDESHTGTAILNVKKKVQAIDQQLKSAMMQCGQLEQEKEVQISTIKAQEDQIRTMEEQLFDLQKKLEESTAENKRIIQAERDTSELCSTLKHQQRKIAALEDQVRMYSMERNDTVHQQIEAYRGANDAKYQEITAMQEKLEMLRRAQNEQSTLVVYTPTQSKKESKAGKSVSFASSCLVPLDRNKSQSTDLDSQSSHTSKSSHSSRSDERPSLA